MRPDSGTGPGLSRKLVPWVHERFRDGLRDSLHFIWRWHAQPWQPPKLDPPGWAPATAPSQEEGQAGPGTPEVSALAMPLPPPLPRTLTSPAGRPGLHNAPFSHVQTSHLDTHAPFCSGGSGVGEGPQRVGFGPRQEEIFPQRRKGWGWMKRHPLQRRQPVVSPARPGTSLPAEHAPISNAGRSCPQRRAVKPIRAAPAWACVPGAA